MLAIDAIFFVFIYQKIEAIFSGIKITILSSKYRYQGQIVQLVFGCLLRVHIFVYHTIFRAYFYFYHQKQIIMATGQPLLKNLTKAG